MILNRLKLARTVKYLGNVVFLIFAPKTLIWNKTTFIASSLLNLAELVKNELIKIIFPNFRNLQLKN